MSMELDNVIAHRETHCGPQNSNTCTFINALPPSVQVGAGSQAGITEMKGTQSRGFLQLGLCGWRLHIAIKLSLNVMHQPCVTSRRNFILNLERKRKKKKASHSRKEDLQ